MRHEYAAGAVLCTERCGKRLFVIVVEKQGHCGFPKGHIEPGETEQQTALRKIREETGICAVLDPTFRAEIAYPKAADCIKHVTVFLARCDVSALPPHSDDVADVLLLDYESAMRRIRLPAIQNVFRTACAHLDRHCAQ